METTSIKAIKELNLSLQESIDNFKNYHIEKELDMHEIKYGPENEYCLSDIIDSVQRVIDNISFLTDNHNFFVQTSIYTERNDIKNNMSNLNSYITNRSYGNLISTIENLKTRIRLYELYINKDRFVELSGEIEYLRNTSTQIFGQIEKQTKEQKIILDNNANTIVEHEETIKNYKEKYSEKLSEAEKLIEEAKLALNYKNAQGLSAAFSNQLQDSQSKWKTISWIIGAAVFIIATLAIGVWIVTGWGMDYDAVSGNNTRMIYNLIGRLSMIPFTITGAIFCANQYTKRKNIIEDYAYKTVLAKSIIAFSEELRDKSPERYTEYLSTILKEIHQDPLRKRVQDKEVVSLKDSKGLIEKLIELLQTTISKS